MLKSDDPPVVLLTADGDVANSAACCCGCCFYPWPDPDGTYNGGPYYLFADLPDTIVFDGVTLSKYLAGTGAYAYTDNLASPSDGAWNVFSVLWASGAGENFWRANPGTANTEFPTSDAWDSNCLIGKWASENSARNIISTDLFFTTYSVTDGTYTETVTRSTNGCAWISAHFRMFYDGLTYKWKVSGTDGASSGAKNDPQNKPDGTYTNGITVS